MNKKSAPAACCPPSPRALEATPVHVEAFKALAHIDRLRVFFALVQACAPLPAKDLQAALALPGPTLSHHLDALEQAGLITRTRRERYILSSVRRDLVVELVRLLTACC
jgi:DNA-binding transcriptional ArsR family regulator